MTTEELIDDGGVVRGRAVLDLSHLRSPEDLAGITRIRGVGAVVVPESLASAYVRIPTEGVGGTVYVPDGVNVRVHTGSLSVSGDGLGAVDDVLVVIGLLVVTSPVTGAVPGRISVVGGVMAPRGSEATLGPSLVSVTGAVTYYRYAEDQDIKMLVGQVKLSGVTLANHVGTADDLMIISGQAVVTGSVTEVGFRQLYITGQLVAPAASRDELEPRLTVVGQVAWHLADEARVIHDDLHIGPDYFELLEGPVSLVLFGDVTFEPGATAELVRRKVTDILLFGDVIAPAELVSVLQVLTTDAFGTIRAADGPEG